MSNTTWTTRTRRLVNASPHRLCRRFRRPITTTRPRIQRRVRPMKTTFYSNSIRRSLNRYNRSIVFKNPSLCRTPTKWPNTWILKQWGVMLRRGVLRLSSKTRWPTVRPVANQSTTVFSWTTPITLITPNKLNSVFPSMFHPNHQPMWSTGRSVITTNRWATIVWQAVDIFWAGIEDGIEIIGIIFDTRRPTGVVVNCRRVWAWIGEGEFMMLLIFNWLNFYRYNSSPNVEINKPKKDSFRVGGIRGIKKTFVRHWLDQNF